MRVLLVVAYDGTNYAGSQIQENAVTVEEVLSRELVRVLGEKVDLIGASRTDSGVHAKGNVWVFDTETSIPAEKISYAVNRSLPEDIVIQRSLEVPDDFHPRYTKTAKTYVYRIVNATFPDPLRSRFTDFVYGDLDVSAMKRAGSCLVGEHDFTSFASVHSQTDSFVRTIYDLSVEQNGDEIDITVRGNGFLYNMVRIIAGTLIAVGLGRMDADRVPEILAARDRKAAGPTAPARGLTLVKIEYKVLDGE